MLTLTFIYVGQAVDQDDFDYPNNLSRTAKNGLESRAPQIGTGDDRVAIVWADGYNDDADTKAGHIFLKSASETDGYWRPKVYVFKATANDWGNDPSFVFDKNHPEIIHVAWAQADSCGGGVGTCEYRTIKYTSCNVSTDYNTCAVPQIIAQSDLPNLAYRNPSMVQDDLNNLHVVWTNDKGTETVYYTLGITSSGSYVWAPYSEVIDANGQPLGEDKNPQLAFSNGRLHLAWDAETPGANAIKYMYDDYYTNTVLTGTFQQVFNQFGSDFSDPGPPTLAIGLGRVFLTFDVAEAVAQGQTPRTFTLLYAEGFNNGSNWTDLRDIPTGNVSNFIEYRSNDEDLTGGLKPDLVITHTNGISRLNVVWHHDTPSDGESYTYQVYHAYRDPAAVIADPWEPAKPLTVTNPIPTPTPTPDLSATLKTTYKTNEVLKTADELTEFAVPLNYLKSQGFDGFDSIEPALAISDIAQGGKGKPHLVYLEKPNISVPDLRYDVHYRGFIAGTIDPEYILDNFTLAYNVQPTLVETNTNPFPAYPLLYQINVTNRGNLNAIGVHITNTLHNLVDLSNATLSSNSGNWNIDINNNNKVITWSGNISANFTLDITLNASSVDGIDLGTNLQAGAYLWNIGSRGQVLITRTVNTSIQGFLAYAPIIFKNSP